MASVFIPADVSKNAHKEFAKNYTAITRGTDRLFLFSCDQKIEHLNDDFNPDMRGIHADALHPEHLFSIASRGNVGAMATHLGLIARYGMQHANVPYIVKLNGGSHLSPLEHKDPLAAPLWSVDDAVALRNNSDLLICGVGATVYIGSMYEDAMLSFASQMVFEAHKHGMVAIIWMYPRGAAVAEHEHDPDLIAGAAGVAHALGADFVKIKPPHTTSSKHAVASLKKIVAAAGNTKVICSGGARIAPEKFYQTLREQLSKGGVAGTATGRNIFQHGLPDAIAIAKKVSSMVYG